MKRKKKRNKDKNRWKDPFLQLVGFQRPSKLAKPSLPKLITPVKRREDPYNMKELDQTEWLNIVMGDYGFTMGDYCYTIAYEQSGLLGGPEFNEFYSPLIKLSFKELMENQNIESMTQEDVNWLLSVGWKDTNVNNYVTKECFNYIKKLIDEKYVDFEGDKVKILQSMYDYPNPEGRESELDDDE